MHIKFMNKNLTEKLIGLYKQNSPELNNLFFIDFIKNNLENFIEKWKFLLNNKIINKLKLITNKYDKIQNLEFIITFKQIKLSNNIIKEKYKEAKEMLQQYLKDKTNIIKNLN